MGEKIIKRLRTKRYNMYNFPDLLCSLHPVRSSAVTNMGLFVVIVSALLLSGKLLRMTFKIMIIYLIKCFSEK